MSEKMAVFIEEDPLKRWALMPKDIITIPSAFVLREILKKRK
jgi:hypothetical protein